MPELRSSLFQFLYNLNTNQLALGQLGRGLECLGVWGLGYVVRETPPLMNTHMDGIF